jgi:hypothetical protein
MAMEKLLKDRYSIEEVSDLLSQGNPDQKQYIRLHLESIYSVEIWEFLLGLRARKGFEDAKWKQALFYYTISREEVMRHADDLKRNDKETSEEKQIEKPKYLFKKTDEGYLMVFEGEEVKLINQIGYAYLHYCMKNSEKEFTNKELELAVRGTFCDPIETRQEMIGSKEFEALKNERDDLKERIAEAERNNDGSIRLLEEKLEKINCFLSQTTVAQRRSKIITDGTIKASKRVSIALFRAIENLSNHEDIYTHFKQAFKPYASCKKYRPSEPLPWIFE